MAPKVKKKRQLPRDGAEEPAEGDRPPKAKKKLKGRAPRDGAEEPAEGDRPPKAKKKKLKGRASRDGAEEPAESDLPPKAKKKLKGRDSRDGAEGPAVKRRAPRDGAKEPAEVDRPAKAKTKKLKRKAPREDADEPAEVDSHPRSAKKKVKRKAPAAAEQAPRRQAREGAAAAAEAGGADSSDEGSFFTHDERKKASLSKEEGSGEEAWSKKKVPEDFKIFVGDLPWSASEDEVRAQFSTYGPFARFDMPKRNGRSDGSAFIYYKTQAAMEKALKMDGQFFEGRTIKVKRATAQNHNKKDDKNVDKHAARQRKDQLTVFIGGLPFGTDLVALKKDFEECGEVESIRTLNDDAGKFKGTAFVVYKSSEAVTKALEWHGADYGGRKIIVRRAGEGVKGDGKGKGAGWNTDHDRTVFVGSLSQELGAEQLESDFAECGPIDKVRIVKDSSGQSKGAAFIVFKSASGAKRALEWDGEYYGDRKVKVSMAQVKDKGDGKGKS